MTNSDDYAPPAGPPPSYGAGASGDYAPPPGPPPGRRVDNDSYAPPPGPPPSHRGGQYDYALPPGPPPSQKDYVPPPGPPPSQAPKKQHDWETAVPDTALLPPPPNYFGAFDRSPTNNATEEEADEGERWCGEHTMFGPATLGERELRALQAGNINLFAPPFFQGALAQVATGVWRLHSRPGARDTSIASYPPLYSVRAHSPLANAGRPKTIYYEVAVLRESRADEVSLALGFSAPPYPPFRLPGWHRGSAAVHGDDGNRYINDRWGGRSFTSPFARGETRGVGMDIGPGRAGGGLEVEVFFTRDGREVGRWDLHEELDGERDLSVTGLEGYHDLCATVGVFDEVDFEIIFAPGKWKWQGYRP
jgi:hypothetical protein